MVMFRILGAIQRNMIFLAPLGGGGGGGSRKVNLSAYEAFINWLAHQDLSKQTFIRETVESIVNAYEEENHEAPVPDVYTMIKGMDWKTQRQIIDGTEIVSKGFRETIVLAWRAEEIKENRQKLINLAAEISREFSRFEKGKESRRAEAVFSILRTGYLTTQDFLPLLRGLGYINAEIRELVSRSFEVNLKATNAFIMIESDPDWCVAGIGTKTALLDDAVSQTIFELKMLSEGEREFVLSFMKDNHTVAWAFLRKALGLL